MPTGAFGPNHGDGCAHGWEVTPLGSPVGALHEALGGPLPGLLASLGWDSCLLDAVPRGKTWLCLALCWLHPSQPLASKAGRSAWGGGDGERGGVSVH